MNLPRYFVLREIEVDAQDIRIGDVFRMEGHPTLHTKALFVAIQNAEKIENEIGNYNVQGMLVQLTHCGFEYNLVVKQLRNGITKL